MLLPSPVSGTLIRRYKRFLGDFRLENEEIVTAHCPNSGRLTGVIEEGAPVVLSYLPSPTRRLSYTWQAVYAQGTWVGVNTHLANDLVEEALIFKKIAPAAEYDYYQREVRYGTNSRVDFLLKKGDELCYLEVKNVHMKRQDQLVEFPDAPTERGLKHLDELIKLRLSGIRCIVLYVIQRNDCTTFSIAQDIDPLYAQRSREALEKGVEMYAYPCAVAPREICLESNCLCMP